MMNDEQWALEPHAFTYDPPTDEMKAAAQAELDYWTEVANTGGGAFPPLAELEWKRAYTKLDRMGYQHMRRVPYKERLPWWAGCEMESM
jgi:hypothetical protein